ncbi:MAG: tetratricopeptide repeat protein [Acidimicrobiales bacterium]
MTTRFHARPRRSGTVGRAGLALIALLAGLAIGRFVFFSAPEPVGAPPAPIDTPAERIAALEARVEEAPDDAAAWQALGLAYVQDSIRTADPSLYDAAGAAFDRADTLAPGSPETLVGRGALALSLHRFPEAARLAGLARAADPYSDEALAVLVDASVELGRYDDAATVLDELLALRPGLPAFSRLSYLRELNGDVTGARLALQQAETAGAGAPYDVATVLVFEGDLLFKQGDLAEAEAAYDGALSSSPDVVLAQIGMARVEAARGSVDDAIERMESVTANTPVPGALVLLGELQELDGRRGDAAATFELVRTVIRLQEAAGADVDLELALFEADHGPGARAVELARAAYADRPTIYAADALGWARRQAGDPVAAVPLVEEALRLGTSDPLLHFHAAATYADAGDLVRARDSLDVALGLNPWFSFAHRAEALDLADRLGVVVP